MDCRPIPTIIRRWCKHSTHQQLGIVSHSNLVNAHAMCLYIQSHEENINVNNLQGRFDDLLKHVSEQFTTEVAQIH